MESFITILYDFEKQWLSSFACKAIVIRPVPQKFICLVKEKNGTFRNEKKCKKKDLIWHMVGEMVKDRVGQGCIFHIIIPAHYTSHQKFYYLS